MKNYGLITILLCCLSVCGNAQTEKKPVAIVFNNGPAEASIRFRYLENTEPSSTTLNFFASTTRPFVANPAIRFYTKNGFNELGFKNLILGSTRLSIPSITNARTEQTYFFLSSFYFNKSYKIFELLEGDVLIGIEPVLSYQNITKSNNLGDLMVYGRSFMAETNLQLRWEHEFTSQLFISASAGISPFMAQLQSVQHKLTDPENISFIDEFSFNQSLEQRVQLSFGIKI